MKKIILIVSVVVMGIVFVLPTTSFARVTFRSPLNTILTPPFSALFDNDGSSTNGVWRDYKCGTLSYDGHSGVDFRAINDTPVISSAAGRVYYKYPDIIRDPNEPPCNDVGFRGSTCGSGFGNHYRVDHADDTRDGQGLVSVYAHMKASSITVPAGTPISCGQQLGLSASSGSSTGPHLHFQLWTDGSNSLTKIDPFKGVGSCSSSPGYWTSVSEAYPAEVPTTQCDNRPLAPSNVSITNPTTSSLQVNFKDNALNETNILVERKIGTSGAWSQIVNFGALSGASGWYWTNRGLSSSATYCYRLRSQNSYGYSDYSNESCGTTLSSSLAPLAPSNVSVTNPTTSSLQVNFKDNATNETNILIERKTVTSGSWTSLGGFGALAGTSSWYWINTSLASKITYCYRLKAINAVGGSAYSNEACGTTL